MKTVSNIFMTFMLMAAIGLTACQDSNKENVQEEHGHSHNEASEHTHEHQEVKQEEFSLSGDSMESEDKTPTEDKGNLEQQH